MNIETLKMGLDGVVLVVLGIAAAGTLLNASKRPASQSIAALIVYTVVFLAVASCASAPSPTPSRPRLASSPERCVALVEQGCGLFAACYGSPLEACLTERAGCVGVQGITQQETDACAAALEQASCGQPIPAACVGIAEPAPPSSPQPKARTL